MFNKIELKSIISSFWVGVIIGGIFNLINGQSQSFDLLISLMTSGGIGVLIAFSTELITLVIPISIARPKSYFLISSMIGITITLIVISFINGFMMKENPLGHMTIIFIGILLVGGINLIDYIRYKKTNERLKVYQNEHF